MHPDHFYSSRSRCPPTTKAEQRDVEVVVRVQTTASTPPPSPRPLRSPRFFPLSTFTHLRLRARASPFSVFISFADVHIFVTVLGIEVSTGCVTVGAAVLGSAQLSRRAKIGNPLRLVFRRFCLPLFPFGASPHSLVYSLPPFIVQYVESDISRCGCPGALTRRAAAAFSSMLPDGQFRTTGNVNIICADCTCVWTLKAAT